MWLRNRWVVRRALPCCAILLCLAATAFAHIPDPKLDREIVRVQGYLGGRPASTALLGEMVLNILGTDHPFHLTAWQRFGLGSESTPSTPDPRLVLQGERSDLAKISQARPQQRITILGERHPGASDLFLLAVDFCPQ